MHVIASAKNTWFSYVLPHMRISPIRVWDAPYAYTHIGRPYTRMGQHFVPHEYYIALPGIIIAT